MKKIVVLFITLFIQSVFAQIQYYHAPTISISDYKQTTETVGGDFGYIPKSQNEIDKGYYIWVENQWYYIINASSLFRITDGDKNYFSIDLSKKPDLKIRDHASGIYSYPIEALDIYKISEHDFRKVKTKIAEVQSKIETLDAPSESQLLDIVEIEVQEIKVPSASQREINAKTQQLNESNFEKDAVKVVSKIKNIDAPSDSELLDVIQIEEVEIKRQVPYKPQEKTTEVSDKNTVITTTVENKKIETKVENNTDNIAEESLNDYELAVSKGFDGTVTEWFESETIKNGISPYQQAKKKGFQGSEKDYLDELWGSGFDDAQTAKAKESRYIMDWINKIKTSDGEAPYERALKHGFYGTFTEWVESVIGTEGEKVYNEEVKKGYKGTYRNWLEEKLNASNDELKRREKLKKQNFLMVPQIQLSLNENPEEISTFSLYNYYKIYFGQSVISSESTHQSVEVNPEDIEYQITWYNKNEVNIESISSDGIVKYRKNISYMGNTTQINVRFIIK